MPTDIWNRRGSAFSNAILQLLFDLHEVVLRPFIFFLTGAWSPFLPITPEERHPNHLLLWKIIVVPIYCIGVMLFLIPMVVAFLIRILLHQFRRPYCVSVKGVLTNGPKSSYTVATANLCLLPEVGARFNNLNRTNYRAKEVGTRIHADKLHYSEMVQKALQSSSQCASEGMSTRSQTKQLTNSQIHVNVLAHFPLVDFFCIQETFDRDYAKILMAELHKVFPFIVYDVGCNGRKLNYFGLNSGLMLASQYEILAVRFRPFTQKCGYSHIFGKGLLMVKVCLESTNGGRKVGYIYNTHLQAFQGDKPIVQTQLSEIEVWTTEFRDETLLVGDSVVLDVLGGDFNIDNMSPGEAHLQTHSLFNMYTDICRERPGKDYDWTIGTEMRTTFLHEPEVSSPDLLKRVLEDPYLRQQFIMDADVEKATMDSIYKAKVKKDAQGNCILSPVGGRRRIDLVMYRKGRPLMEVENYSLITRLAPLTDHIPVAITFKCANSNPY